MVVTCHEGTNGVIRRSRSIPWDTSRRRQPLLNYHAFLALGLSCRVERVETNRACLAHFGDPVQHPLIPAESVLVLVLWSETIGLSVGAAHTVPYHHVRTGDAGLRIAAPLSRYIQGECLPAINDSNGNCAYVL